MDRRPVHRDLLALTEQQAARLARVGPARLRSWGKRGVLRPGIERPISQRNTVRLYQFDDLVDLLIVTQLLEWNFTLKRIGNLLGKLRALGYERIASVRIGRSGKEIVFQHRDSGLWEGDLNDGQLLIALVLDIQAIETEILRFVDQRRSPTEQGQVVKMRGVLGSKPVFAGTRIPVEAVRSFLRRGAPTERILAAYPSLSPADVEAARAGM